MQSLTAWLFCVLLVILGEEEGDEKVDEVGDDGCHEASDCVGEDCFRSQFAVAH